MKLKRGDLIEVQWLDIMEDVTGNPDKADICPRVSIGYFWDIHPSKHGSVFVTTTTIDKDVVGQNGFCAYPDLCVDHVRMIRRGKGKVYREQSTFEWRESEGDGPTCAGFAGPGDPAKQRGKGKVRGSGAIPLDVSEVPESREP